MAFRTHGAISISHKRIIFLHISMVEQGGGGSLRGKAAPLADSQADRRGLEAQRLRRRHWDNEPTSKVCVFGAFR
jgi:hypothetical protein